MRKLNYSRQREAIKDFLYTGSHPTADEVYLKVKEQFPNVSLGTVYRNLNLLAERGEIKKLTFAGSPDRFDRNLSKHYHMLCRCCGKVSDLFLPQFDIDLDSLNEGNDTGLIEGYSISCVGVCKECIEKGEARTV